jgi:hypothetical protein
MLGYKRSEIVKLKGGRRTDIGFYVRSSWEANLVRWFRFSGIEFQYEPCEFEFKGIKRGNRFYKPDFYLPAENKYVELKGWLDAESKTKLKRMQQYYPDIAKNMVIYISKVFLGGVKLSKDASALIMMGYRLDQLCDYSSLSNKARMIMREWE